MASSAAPASANPNSIKGPSLLPPTSFANASTLRIGIVHARWNKQCIDPLVRGCIESLTAAGIKQDNIVVESVPGSWELPIGVSRLIAAGQTQASSNVSDLISAASLLDAPPQAEGATASSAPTANAKPRAFSAIIAVGVLIKGSTMHFEYISDSACHGLMRVGLDTGVPVILGILTALTEEQALLRSGIGEGGHNHGLDWGSAAAEMASKATRWSEGSMEL
ncbi:lumazine synthase [Tilletia horrida]|uniref:6,7-dimethyl-8-ribityllumazine synthase n=1 Tax=Tilletia horrida TaxID=155126 RepID=A0AAN6GM62_9BASI|nr:lumazine synthase [Tilletia horrida]KAK0544688.1 lumazine synthase [Tilletia horrida]